jgi:N-methylhydantoinase B/oxoprolinase/acetone carboxylase alpha subunit
VAADDIGGGRGAKALRRTSFSTLVNESNDFACVLDGCGGQSAAQNTRAFRRSSVRCLSR